METLRGRGGSGGDNVAPPGRLDRCARTERRRAHPPCSDPAQIWSAEAAVLRCPYVSAEGSCRRLGAPWSGQGRIDELRKEWQELKAQADGIRAARNGWCSKTALANMSRLAADLDGTVAAARQSARQRKQEWDNTTIQIETFARQLARGDEERKVADDGAEDSSEPTQLLGSQLHAELQEGLSLVSERLWGTTREQHAREVGRVGVLLWGTQCFLFQCFRHYLSKARWAAPR